MLRRLTSIITILFVFLFSLFLVPKAFPVRATSYTDIENAISGNGTLDKNLKEFCEKRSGNQMNLETWYSGKCTDDTFSGEGVGFSDIVFLDLAEKVMGKKDPNNTFLDILFKLIIEIKDVVISDTSSQEKQQIYADARTELNRSQSGGVISEVNKGLSFIISNPPASTTTYIAHISNNLKKHQVIPEAYAASSGTGFSTFSGLIPLWTASRNIAYLAIVVFFIVYGFMMMFRVNLGQKTVISVQLAIPKLIVTILMITFSYAIVGLVIDLMWVVIYFFYSFLMSQNILKNSAGGVLPFMAYGNMGVVWSAIVNLVTALPASAIAINQLFIGDNVISTVASSVVGALWFGPIISLILGLAILIAYGKLLWQLLQSLISIVISLITGPIILLGNAFPGSSTIGDWFRNILANASVFPVSMIFLVLSYILMVQPILGICGDLVSLVPGASALGGVGVCENLIGVNPLYNQDNINIPLFEPVLSGSFLASNTNTQRGFAPEAFLGIIGIGLLIMASKYVDIVKGALKVPPFKYGADIGNSFTESSGLLKNWKKNAEERAAKRASAAGSSGGGKTPPPPSKKP